MQRYNVIQEKSFDFAVRIVNLHKFLTKEKKEYTLSSQILRSGTSIGANINEGIQAYSKADFTAKLSIALKETCETDYWIRLLHKTEYLDESQFKSIQKDCQEIIKILTSIIKKSKQE